MEGLTGIIIGVVVFLIVLLILFKFVIPLVGFAIKMVILIALIGGAAFIAKHFFA